MERQRSRRGRRGRDEEVDKEDDGETKKFKRKMMERRRSF